MVTLLPRKTPPQTAPPMAIMVNCLWLNCRCKPSDSPELLLSGMSQRYSAAESRVLSVGGIFPRPASATSNRAQVFCEASYLLQRVVVHQRGANGAALQGNSQPLQQPRRVHVSVPHSDALIGECGGYGRGSPPLDGGAYGGHTSGGKPGVLHD